MNLKQRLLSDPKVRALIEAEKKRNADLRAEMMTFSHSAQLLVARLEASLTPENVWRAPRD